MNPKLTTLIALQTLLISACGGGGGGYGSEPAPAPAPAPAACVPTTPPAPPAAGALPPQVTLALSNGSGVAGNVVITLNPTAAPATVANFLSYVNSGFYSCTVVHRYTPGFVAQGGGYAGPLVAGGAVPTHKATSAAIVLEDNAGLSNLRLTVAMARLSAPDSATSEFFVNLADNTFLDRTATARGYAVFGSVTAGSEVIAAMATAPCAAWSAFLPNDGSCLPSPNVFITTATQTR